MGEARRILFLDDSDERIAIARSMYASDNLTVCKTSSEAISCLHDNEYDIVSLDHDLGPSDDGMRVAKWMARRQPFVHQYVRVHSWNAPAAHFMRKRLTDSGYRVFVVPFGL